MANKMWLSKSLSAVGSDLEAASSPSSDRVPKTSLFEIGKAFATIGLFSFGGGNASQLLLRNEVVRNQHWLTDEEYNRTWRLSRLTIGIPQIAQVIQYGLMLAGWRGMCVAVMGFLLPCFLISLMLSAVLVATIGNRYLEDALRLIVPLTGGMTMALALQMWNPRMPAGRNDWMRLLAQCVVVLTGAFLVGVIQIPVPLVMLAALCIGALISA